MHFIIFQLTRFDVDRIGGVIAARNPVESQFAGVLNSEFPAEISTSFPNVTTLNYDSDPLATIDKPVRFVTAFLSS